ncbi:MAG: hypothetical protein KJO20_01985 [Eudoraea sp.]|nr:hypothetical protein [Eudoraea sp.]MBT8320860.1 hypothetical protein [Eudoraea sp.]
MELVTIGLGLLVNTCVKNKAVNTAIDDFVTDSVNWMRGWFKKKDEGQLINKIVEDPKAPEVKKELEDAMNEMVKDEQFKKELQLWIRESKKPSPSMKNVLEDIDIEVEGNIKIGDKTASTEKHDMKNVIKKGKIKGGGDFILGDG